MEFHPQHLYKVYLAEAKAGEAKLANEEYICSGAVVMSSAAGWYVGEMCFTQYEEEGMGFLCPEPWDRYTEYLNTKDSAMAYYRSQWLEAGVSTEVLKESVDGIKLLAKSNLFSDDIQVYTPKAGQTYEGFVVGSTDYHVLQQVSDRCVVHRNSGADYIDVQHGMELVWSYQGSLESKSVRKAADRATPKPSAPEAPGLGR